MRAAVAGIGLVMLVAVCFWLYRGSQSFRRALGDYVPTPYAASEGGRERLTEALKLTQRVGWTLSDGTRQNAFYWPGHNGALILYAHGSPGDGLNMMPEARALHARGYGALLLDLPGYGLSEGDRAWNEQSLESVHKAVDFGQAQPGVDETRIGGFGYSNGGSLIARAAAADPRIRALVLVASYTNLSDQLHHSFRRRVPGVGYFAVAAGVWSGVPVADLDTVAALRTLGPRRVLILSGGRDAAIPVEMADLLQSASDRAEMILFEEVGHVDFLGQLGAAYVGPLNNFWDEALAPESSPSPH